MNTDQEPLQDVDSCTEDDSKLQSEQKPYVMIVPDEELLRHERFREAVKQVLSQQGKELKEPIKKGREVAGRYKSLLTKSELNFLLK
ncbi:MAG: hypothetical protein RBR38_08090 [Desulfomicrobium apsheronum]|nr:hypothetical protein [Desulfomicrobium apsheronum]